MGFWLLLSWASVLLLRLRVIIILYEDVSEYICPGDLYQLLCIAEEGFQAAFCGHFFADAFFRIKNLFVSLIKRSCYKCLLDPFLICPPKKRIYVKINLLLRQLWATKVGSNKPLNHRYYYFPLSLCSTFQITISLYCGFSNICKIWLKDDV